MRNMRDKKGSEKHGKQGMVASERKYREWKY